jgi:predicted CXXCH cytochrome family protein
MPVTGVPEGASCVTPECHSRFGVARHVHQPVSQNECFSCHEHDTGGHRYPLSRTGNDTCTFCHAVTGTLEHQHEALKDGCVTCHNPHASHTDFLLTELSVPQLCGKCHQQEQKAFSHRPFLEGQCSQCHEPHQSANLHLLRGGEGAEHCFSCHGDLAVELKHASFVHDPALKNCNTCHNAHSSDHEHHLHKPIEQTCASCHADVDKQMKSAKFPHEAVSMDKKCVNCHDGHAAEQRGLRRDSDVTLCLRCHAEPVKGRDGRSIDGMADLLKRQFLHGPIKAGECSACHAVHGGDHPALLSAAFPKGFYTNFAIEKYELCFNCHSAQLVLEPKTAQLTGFRDGDRNLHYVHVNRAEKGRTCRTCHDIHGSNLPNHMASSVPFEGGSWSMPLRFEKAEDGGSCSPGCHEPKTYTRTAAHAQASPAGGAP